MKHTFYPCVFFFAFVLISCQPEEKINVADNQKDTLISEVTLQQAMKTFQLQEAQKQKTRQTRRDGYFLDLLPEWNTFEKHSLGDGFSFSQVQTTFFDSEKGGDLIFFNVKDSVISYLVTTKVDTLNATETHYFFKTDGSFVDAYQFDGELMSHLVLAKKNTMTARSTNEHGCDRIERRADESCIELEEVVVYGYDSDKNVARKNGIQNLSPLSYFYFRIGKCYGDDYDCRKAEMDKLDKEFRKQAIKIRRRHGGVAPQRDRFREKIDSIYHNFKNYPCANDLIEKLPKLNNSIANLVKKTFKADGKLNISFEVKKLNENIDGLNELVYRNKTGDTLNFKITLNESILKTSTKDYILVTMYHEVLHAYLETERERLKIKISENEYDYSEFEKKYPNVYIHNTQGIHKGKAYSKSQFLINKDHFKFGHYINKLADAIESYNPQLSRETALAMAKTGIIRPSELYSWEKELNESHRNGTASNGKKCKNGKR